MLDVGKTAIGAAAIVLCLSGAARSAIYAPLNCVAARTPTDRAICRHYALGQLEARMATLYEWTTALVAMGQRGNIQDAQRAFLKKRTACGANVACIRRAYDRRIAQLDAVMREIASHGPY